MLLSCYIPAADSYTFPGGLNISTGDLIFWKYSVRPDRKLQGPNIFCCRIFSTITPHFIALISADSQDKSPGIRPIGIGETLRWLIGKMILQIAREDILSMVMSRQLCRTRSRLWEQCPGDEMCFWRHRHRCCTFCGCVKRLQLSQSAGSIEKCSHPMPYLGTSTYQHISRQRQAVHWGRTHPVARGHHSRWPSCHGYVCHWHIPPNPGTSRRCSSVLVRRQCPSWMTELRFLRTWWDRLEMAVPHYGYYPNPAKT